MANFIEDILEAIGIYKLINALDELNTIGEYIKELLPLADIASENIWLIPNIIMVIAIVLLLITVAIAIKKSR